MFVIEPKTLLGKHFSCECGREHEVPTREIVIAKDAIEQLADVCRRNRLTGACNLVADETTYEVCGRMVEAHLRKNGYCIHTIVLPLPVEADDETCMHLLSLADRSADFWVAVGSGTINDLTKFVSTQVSQAYVVVATAPSMNGYTSAISALTIRGFKKTQPSKPPIAVLADLDVLCDAPYELIAAGLGDVMSKPVSNADWQIAHIVHNEYICQVPLELLREIEPLYFANSSLLAQRNEQAIMSLMEALCYSGIAMTIGSSSSPASGGEHLIAHTLEMRAKMLGKKRNLHGALVGVGTIVCTALYERILELDVANLDLEQLTQRYLPIDAWMPELRSFYGQVGDDVIEEFAAKHPKSQAEYRDELERLLRNWDAIRAAILSVHRPASEIRDVLRSAGAPTTPDELDISESEFCNAFLYARAMRRRYTVLDLADELGVLPQKVNELLERTRVARPSCL